MRKTLIIVRHAKSSWKSDAATDKERPLNKRGRYAAPIIGERIMAAGFLPDLVLSSDSVRTIQTWLGMTEHMPDDIPVKFLAELYGCTVDTITTLIRQQDEKIHTLMVIAHNPTLEMLCYSLSSETVSMKSANAVILTIEDHTWAEAAYSSQWQFIAHLTPVYMGPESLMNSHLKKRYFHPELSHLMFEQRVLGLTKLEGCPVLEKLRFIGISQNNLEDFFFNRMMKLLTDRQTTRNRRKNRMLINHYAQSIKNQQYDILCNVADYLSKLQCNVIIPTNSDFPAAIDNLIQENIASIATVLSISKIKKNKLKVERLRNYYNFVSAFEDEELSLIQISKDIPYFYHYQENGVSWIIPLPVIVKNGFEALCGKKTKAYEIRVTKGRRIKRPKNLSLEQTILSLKLELERREAQPVLKLDVDQDCPEAILDTLAKVFQIDTYQIYTSPTFLLTELIMNLYKQLDYPELKFESINEIDTNFNGYPEDDEMYLFPNDSYYKFIRTLQKASIDPDVEEIYVTLYRVEQFSLLVTTLCVAADRGKKVTAYVELFAREEERHNLQIFDKLRHSGIIVNYFVKRPVVHAKFGLIVFNKTAKFQRLALLSTGNFHAYHAKSYSDVALLTYDEKLTSDIYKVFQYLSNDTSRFPRLASLLAGPGLMSVKLIQLIDREIENKEKGKPAFIVTKINVLSDQFLINKLYEASQKGVLIVLVVRGICSLNPQSEEQSENIYVFSVLGRWLEHGRIHLFHNDGKNEVYCGSANWSRKKLYQRIEMIFPIQKQSFKNRLVNESLFCQTSPLCECWELDSTGHYTKLDEPLESKVVKIFDARNLSLQV